MSNNIDFYNPHNMLSYDALFNYILTERGKGKTYGIAKKKPIDNFLKSEEQFIYLRRYKEELKDIGSFFTDIEEAYPEHVFHVKGRTFYCDNKVMGYAVALSQGNMKKSTAYPKVTSIVYDEFVLEKGFIRYLPNEVSVFLNFYETVARTRENVKVYFLGNSISLANPYFLEFKIMPNVNKRFTSAKSFTNDKGVREHLTLVEIGQDDDNFRTMKRKSRFGMLTEGTDFAKTTVDNQFINDHDSFIEKKHSKSIFMYSISYMGDTFGVWASGITGKMYITSSYAKNSGRNFAMTTEDHRPNMILIDNFRKTNQLMKLKKAFNHGYLMFENMNIRSVMYDILKLLK